MLETSVKDASAEPRDAASIRSAVDSHRLWYHTIDLGEGVVTPGWFDLRTVVDSMPWPDVRGKRCLDVGTYDGFLAFELERRGAAEVLATDISDPSGWDWPVLSRERGTEVLASTAGEKTGQGFEIAKHALGSSVQRVEVSIYELSPESLGRFDVVVCGSLMLHLRDPIRGLEAIRGVCDGFFLSAEQVELRLALGQRRRPVAELKGGTNCQWWIPNPLGHRRMLTAAGFEIERSVGPYAIPLGKGHPSRGEPARRLRQRALSRLLAGGSGVPHSALLAKPA